MLQFGGKKQKGKKQKKIEYEDIFSLDVGIIQKFGLVSVSPPTTVEDLDLKLTQIEEKKSWYEENGQSAMKEKINELVMQQKLLEEQEKEQALKEKLAQQEYEEREEQRPRGRGGRGGRGRGGYGNYDEDRPRRGGMSRGSRPERTEAYREKSEFEGEDDDTAYAAPVRPQQKKAAKQLKTDLEKNEDNYPTL